jgi:hypothetical protein
MVAEPGPDMRIRALTSGSTMGAENLCNQAIFMNHATSAVTPPDPELIQDGNAIGWRAQRRGLAEGQCQPSVRDRLPGGPVAVMTGWPWERCRAGRGPATGAAATC